MDPTQIVPEHIQQGFREEYRTLMAQKREAEREAIAQHINSRAVQQPSAAGSRPSTGAGLSSPYTGIISLSEVNSRGNSRGGNGAPFSLETPIVGGSSAPMPTTKGRRHVASRAASSSIGSILTGMDE